MSPHPIDRADSSRNRSTERFISRLGTSLASPLGILLIMPGLVSLVGSFLTLLGERALQGSNLEVAQDRMLEQARLVAASVRDALDQSEPMLDRLYDMTLHHDATQPYEAYAHGMLDLMRGRPGVTYVSASFPDGTFQGAYVDVDGAIRFQDSRVEAQGTRVRRYDYGSRDILVLQREDRSAYDPRTRSFYRTATHQQRRIWTEPYLFYDSQTAGITRAAPVYVDRDGGRVLHAVITVDFDVNALSSYLGTRQLGSTRALLYASDGSILAYAADAQAALRMVPSGDRPLRFQDLNDPLLQSFFGAARQLDMSEARVTTVAALGERWLSAIAPVSRDPTLGWSMAYLVPEAQFLRKLHVYEDSSLLIGGSAVLLSTLLAYLFARHITRVREEAAVAKAEAREARALAREARAEARELGSYRLVARLGRGGMGEVWRAQHRLLAREAAVKLIKNPEGGAVSDGMRTRFRREAEALARLRSRNTIELFDYGVAEDGTFFLVMELLDGVDLETLVEQYGPQPPERVVSLLAQVCNSLVEAHSHGLVHRDIKPANLFVCRAAEEVDVVKVLDFGLVRAVKDRAEQPTSIAHELSMRLTNPDGMVGTPAFMAPEQVQGRTVDQRADLYALGGVAFFLLTGKLVFGTDNPVDQLLAHIHEPVPDLRPMLPASVPEALAQVIATCMAKQPADRYDDARALRSALRAVVFPPHTAWTEERAQAWWLAHGPRPSEHPEGNPLELTVAAATVSLGITRRDDP